jgi:hypothetical protein
VTSKAQFGTVTIPLMLVIALFLLAAASPVHAQATSPAPEIDLLATNNIDSDTSLLPEVNGEATAADSTAQTTAAATPEPSGKDNQWHISVSPYLWFPGMYGTVGFPNRNVKVHASAGEVLSHFRFGLAGFVEVRRKWLVLPLDMLWVRLEDDHPLPLEAGVVSANAKLGEFLLTPKVGIRFVDQERIKVDFLTGFRYWHIETNLAFNPSALGLSFSRALNWVDPLVGGRIQLPLSPKILVDLSGDVGGWGTGSLIEYQLVGLLGYKIKPRWTLQAGYRYLRVAYRSGLFLLNLDDPGVAFGATINLK